MNKEQYNDLLQQTIVIDRNYGRVSHQQTHQDMLRLIIRLTTELYETQQELKKIKQEMVTDK